MKNSFSVLIALPTGFFRYLTGLLYYWLRQLPFSSSNIYARACCNVSFNNLRPHLLDATSTTSFSKHYLYHVYWALDLVLKNAPSVHYDFGSSLYFASLLSATLPVKFYDFRPPNLKLPNLFLDSCDISNLSEFLADSINSLSCLHVIEHIGLGRYGDNLDYYGDVKACNEIQRILAFDGHLLIAVPLAGQPRNLYNANRIYSFNEVISMFHSLTLVNFSLITDEGFKGPPFIDNTTEALEFLELQTHGCGCFHFTKK